MYKIHCLNNISHFGTDLLTADYALTDNLDEATGILVRSADLHETEFPESLLGIARAGAGVNNIPLDTTAEQGIVVFNTPGANANAVKEITLCGLFLGSRDIVGGVEWCKANADDPAIDKSVEKAKKQFAGREVIGKKLGVLGLGAIGAIVANAAVDLGMEVYGYDPYVSVGAAWKISSKVHYVENADEIYKNCDYISIHVPVTDSTKGMIDEHACMLMKEDAVFLNFARAALVDTAAMGRAMEAGHIKCYITDFPNAEVMQLPRVVPIPHLGASTDEAEDNCAIMATQQLMDYIENGNIKNSVNYPACNMGSAADAGGRIAVLHSNVPNMIGQISGALGDAGANIANMTNGARGDNAYTLIDLDAAAPEAAIAALEGIEGVHRVRVIK